MEDAAGELKAVPSPGESHDAERGPCRFGCSVIRAIVLGERERLSSSFLDHTRRLGLAHLLAISGLHVGMVWLVLVLVLRPLGRAADVVSLLAVVGYAGLVGAGASVVRAVAMVAVVVLARASGRRPDTTSVLALAVSVLVIVDPARVFELSFQLSVSAVLGAGVAHAADPQSSL